jgi:RNA polymerase sigma-70 factor (ECF subfamily)
MIFATGEQWPDRALAAAFLASRSEAMFRLIYRRHTARMYRVSRRLTGGSPGLAEEVVQEAWLRAIRALPGFAWRSSLSSWLVGFVINVARETRRDGRPIWMEAPVEAAEPPDLALADAMAELPEGYRAVLVLHDVGGFTHGEIAAILGVVEGSSKSQLAHARRRMRSLLEERT